MDLSKIRTADTPPVHIIHRQGASFSPLIHSQCRFSSIGQSINLALVDILDLSEVAWTCWDVSTPRSGLGLRMVKELDQQLALGMNERRKTGSLPVYDIMHRWGVGGSNLRQTQS